MHRHSQVPHRKRHWALRLGPSRTLPGTFLEQLLFFGGALACAVVPRLVPQDAGGCLAQREVHAHPRSDAARRRPVAVAVVVERDATLGAHYKGDVLGMCLTCQCALITPCFRLLRFQLVT